MTDRLRELTDAREHVDPGWDAAHADRVLGRVHTRIVSQRRQRRVIASLAVAAAVCGLVAGGVRYGRNTAHTAAAPVASSATPENVLRYSDGSLATSFSTGTQIQIVEASAARMVSSLERGAARFDIVPNPEREFRVRIEGVTVTVLGTIFIVDRAENSVHVAVERGRVRVESPTGSAILEVGQSGDYPLAAATAASVAPPPSAASVKAPATSPSWRALAKSGRPLEAYAIVHELGPAHLRDAEELLAAADVARLAGHPFDAVPFLERVLAEFRTDARAPIAALSLGRVLLGSRPAEAASKFALARALAPSGSLAEDALAHEVDAWARAGNTARARAAAEEYVKRYPQGSRIDQVKKLGGL